MTIHSFYHSVVRSFGYTFIHSLIHTVTSIIIVQHIHTDINNSTNTHVTLILDKRLRKRICTHTNNTISNKGTHTRTQLHLHFSVLVCLHTHKKHYYVKYKSNLSSFVVGIIIFNHSTKEPKNA